MALLDTQTSDHDERIVIGLGLFPPNLLAAIHFRIEPRLLVTNRREGRAFVF